MSPHCDLALEDRIPFYFLHMTFQLMVVHHNTKFGYKKVAYKHSAKCVTSVTSLTPEDTTVLSLL